MKTKNQLIEEYKEKYKKAKTALDRKIIEFQARVVKGEFYREGNQ